MTAVIHSYTDNWIIDGASTMNPESITFPTLTGQNLNREEIQLPEGFSGKFNVVFVAFQQWQQQQVDSWIPAIKELSQRHPELDYFELPVISDRNFLWKLLINEGMRAGIPNDDTRQRTITLYLDKSAFREALDMPNEDDIYVLLLNESNRVVWRGRGWHSDEAMKQLINSL